MAKDTRSGYRNIVTRRVAVGARPGTAKLYVAGVALYSSLCDSGDGRTSVGPLAQVSVVTLGQVMAEASIERCHYLKMDCEGSEHEILRSLDAETATRLDEITLESHDVPGSDAGYLARRLRELGFEVYDGPLLHAKRSTGRGA